MMTAALLRLIQTIVFGTLSKAIDLICILALFILMECCYVLDWYANMFAVIGGLVVQFNADPVAIHTRMQRMEWFSRHVHRLSGHLLDGFLVFLISCSIAGIFIGITHAVLSQMGPDSDDKGEAEDDINRAVAESAEAQETETHDAEPPATKDNDSDVKNTTVKATSDPIKNVQEKPSATPPLAFLTVRDLLRQNATLQQENTGLEVVSQEKKEGAGSFRLRRPYCKTDFKPGHDANAYTSWQAFGTGEKGIEEDCKGGDD